MNFASITHSTLDHGALPAPDAFYRQNVERYRRYGSKAWAVCPFHPSSNRGRSHSTPLSIDLNRGLFHCFSCGVGGDIVQFVRLRDGCDFITAARALGALRPLGSVQAQIYRRDRAAKLGCQQRREDDFYESIRLLLKELEIYESVQRWAFRQRNDELQDLAERLITAVGSEYIRLKAEAQ